MQEVGELLGAFRVLAFRADVFVIPQRPERTKNNRKRKTILIKDILKDTYVHAFDHIIHIVYILLYFPYKTLYLFFLS